MTLHVHGRTLRRRLKVETLEVRDVPSTVTFRSIDGSGNNLLHPDWGTAGSEFLRIAGAEYGDGISTAAGADRPSPRVISNTIADQGDEDILSRSGLSAMIFAWGQFLDHDLDLTPTGSTESMDIAVPTGDPYFDPNGTGTQVIRFRRSTFDPDTGTSTTNPRQQVNAVTAWIDGSQVYGSDERTANLLRTHVGGRLKMSVDGLLPLNNAENFGTDTLPVGPSTFFAAGDVRVNENPELTALHTLFVREHNRLADKISAENPGLSDEEVYQRARAIVIAELQVITYREWLPTVIGHGAMTPYAGYRPQVNPAIANEFATAGFRLGHTMLSDDVGFLDENGLPIADEVSLAESFFNPGLLQENGVESIFKFLASESSSEIDNKIVGSVRNFLFGAPGAGGLDLASLNIQRGRDHGLADYNALRAAYGLPRVTDFNQITRNADTADRLRQLYGSVDNIDAWVGALAEDHVPGAEVGPLVQRILADQFQRLRDGDRYWYQNTFRGEELRNMEQTTLSGLIRRNTELQNIQADAFHFRVGIEGTLFDDRNGSGRREFGERGLAGRTVELINVADGLVVATARTDAFGRYAFNQLNGLGLGTFQVREVTSSGSAAVSREITLTRGDTFVRNADLASRFAQQSTLEAPDQPSAPPRPRGRRFGVNPEVRGMDLILGVSADG